MASRRCLICANMNPCSKHSEEAQRQELSRNDEAVALIRASNPRNPTMTDKLVERLREPIIADAMAAGEITNGILAERIINERGEAANALTAQAEEIEMLRGQVRVAVDGAQPLWSGEVAAKDTEIARLTAMVEEARGVVESLLAWDTPPGSDPNQRMKLLEHWAKVRLGLRPLLTKISKVVPQLPRRGNDNAPLGLSVEVAELFDPTGKLPIHTWTVEAVNEGSEGEVYQSYFVGPAAEQRAHDYAAFLAKLGAGATGEKS